MEKLLGSKYMETINSLDGKNYLFYIVDCAIAPVIKGIKPASVLNFCRGSKNLYGLWENNKNYFIQTHNIEFVTLDKNENKELVLFFNRRGLISRLENEENVKFLSRYGYKENINIEGSIYKLHERFRSGFPHEIGIFLGIPLKDVEEFIKNSGKNYLINGYWKVYHDLSGAINVFESYDRAKMEFIEQFSKSIN